MLEDSKLFTQGPYGQIAASLAHIKTTPKSTETAGEDEAAGNLLDEGVLSGASKVSSMDEAEEVNHELELLRQKGSWSVYTYFFKVRTRSLFGLVLFPLSIKATLLTSFEERRILPSGPVILVLFDGYRLQQCRRYVGSGVTSSLIKLMFSPSRLAAAVGQGE